MLASLADRTTVDLFREPLTGSRIPIRNILSHFWQLTVGLGVTVGLITGTLSLISYFDDDKIPVFKGTLSTRLDDVLLGHNNSWAAFLSEHDQQTVYVDLTVFVTQEGINAKRVCDKEPEFLLMHAEEDAFVLWYIDESEETPESDIPMQDICAFYSDLDYSPIANSVFEFDLSSPPAGASISGPHRNSANVLSYSDTISGFFQINSSSNGGVLHYILNPSIVEPNISRAIREDLALIGGS